MERMPTAGRRARRAARAGTRGPDQRQPNGEGVGRRRALPRMRGRAGKPAAVRRMPRRVETGGRQTPVAVRGVRPSAHQPRAHRPGRPARLRSRDRAVRNRRQVRKDAKWRPCCSATCGSEIKRHRLFAVSERGRPQRSTRTTPGQPFLDQPPDFSSAVVVIISIRERSARGGPAARQRCTSDTPKSSSARWISHSSPSNRLRRQSAAAPGRRGSGAERSAGWTQA